MSIFPTKLWTAGGSFMRDSMGVEGYSVRCCCCCSSPRLLLPLEGVLLVLRFKPPVNGVLSMAPVGVRRIESNRQPPKLLDGGVRTAAGERGVKDRFADALRLPAAVTLPRPAPPRSFPACVTEAAPGEAGRLPSAIQPRTSL